MPNMFAEIGAILKLDDQASQALERVRGGFDKVGEKVSEVKREFLDFGKQIAATAIGFNLFNGIESVKKFGSEIINTATQFHVQQRELTSTLLMTDRMGKSMTQLKDQAVDLTEEFEKFGIEVGVSKESMLNAFTMISERSNKSTEEVKELTKNMAIVGKETQGGMQGIAEGMTMIELGMIRGRNEVVKLVTAQHLLKGSARDVANQMMKMSEPKRLELAEKAINNMAEKMKNKGSVLDFDQIIVSLKEIREKLFETVGIPLVDHLKVQLNRLRQYFIDHQAVIEHWAHVLGDKVGEWVDIAAEKMKEGFEYIQNHAKEIKEAIVSAWNTAKQVVEFIIAHKEEIAMIYGAKLAAPAVGGALNAAKMIAGPGAGIVANTAALAALTAAVVAWMGVADQANKLGKENNLNTLEVLKTFGTSMLAGGPVFGPIMAAMKLKQQGETSQNADAKKGALDRMMDDTASAHHLDEFNKLRSQYIQLAKLRGDDSAVVQNYINVLDQHYYAMRNAVTAIDQAAQQTDINQWAKIYNEAAQNHNSGMMEYAASIIAGDEKLQTALMYGSNQLEGGYGKLADMVATKSEDFAKILRGMDKETTKQKAFNVNFNGGQTFNIKQDFRDQDPDRIAFVFQRDVIKAAEQRRQSRMGSAFGL